MGRVQGKVAIVTGAASGLGEADARMLAAEGASVILTDLNDAAGKEVARELSAEFIHQDVSQEDDWSALVDHVMDRYGRVDVLVNNAGIAIIANIEETTTDIWRRTLAVHLDGTYFGCRYVLPAMIRSGGGSIINMSSTAALVGIAPYFAYSAAKGGIRSLTKSLAVHCRQQKNGVRCNSVHPGSIDTPMVAAALEGLSNIKLDEVADREATRLAMGLGEPNDVAHMVIFLASDESKHVTGTEMVVDNADTIA
jgi:3(or 17)beta-hydroxysteroid dehydrogenase